MKMVIEALLDTHVVLWATLNPARLSDRAEKLIKDERSTLYVSAATAYEIANKVRKGNLPEAEELERRFMAVMDEARFTLVPLDVETALRGGRLVGEHRDPWDRLIAAQALALDVPVISNDVQLDAFGIRRIW
jgi:PIN domain nuclease of toxin-antitoxin system